MTTPLAGVIARAKKTWFKSPIQKGMGRDDIIKNVKFEQYRDVRNYYRMNLFISCYFHFLISDRA